MQRYFIGVGTNIDPQTNILRIVHELLKIASYIHMSRIIETEPVGMISHHRFLNFTVCLDCEIANDELKACFNKIETQLGRNRHDPHSAVKDRPADLDILFVVDATEKTINSAKLPQEGYLRPTTVELLTYIGIKIEDEETRNLEAQGVEILTPFGLLGKKPVTLQALAENDGFKIITRLPKI